MQKAFLKDFKKGWFLGGTFEPTLSKHPDFEIAVKFYNKGDWEDKHVHMIATEYTVVTTGCISLNGQYYYTGEIAMVEPGESVEFKAMEISTCVVVKMPSVVGDKYALEPLFNS